MADARFDAQLRPGERLLWSGPAGQGVVVEAPDWASIVFGLAFAAMSLSLFSGNDTAEYSFAGKTMDQHTGSIIALLVGGLLVVIGAYISIGRLIVDAIGRRGMVYAVTDSRILFAKPAAPDQLAGFSVSSFPEVNYIGRGNGKGSIVFGKLSSMESSNEGLMIIPRPRFVGIDDARRVYDLIMAVRRGDPELAPEPGPTVHAQRAAG